ncbi:hypothetical protein HMN09_00207500 [Mycena chlorophos]|uniref:F-box domain-containing protein n=1 Tax=Mycena chlorophos TaxID=658473 RepID=A0A8H6TSY9_MYCCL|nr:hypothetical protein HMN09_00207500 [Mycena chlorophos]
MVCPTTRLPPELIVAIFELCLPARPHVSSPHHAPLLLSQITRAWRAFTLTAPSLWSTAVFSHAGSPELLELWLESSGECPLTLDLAAKNEARAYEYALEIMRHAPRWKDVRLNMPLQALRPLYDYAGGFPALENLSIVASQYPLAGRGLGSESGSWRVAGAAPMLRSATFFAYGLLNVLLPLEDLTVLRLDSLPDPRKAVALLKQCQVLQKFACQQYESLGDQSDSTIFTHLALSSVDVAPETFVLLNLPNLRQVQLACPTHNEALTRAARFLRALVRRSKCQITSLCVYLGQNWRFRELESLVDEYPGLVHLRLRFSSSDAGHEFRLVAHDGSSSLAAVFQPRAGGARLAQLANLEICDYGWWEMEQLVAIVRQRGLQSLRWHSTLYTEPPTARELEKLQELKMDGVDVLVACGLDHVGRGVVSFVGTVPAGEAWWME